MLIPRPELGALLVYVGVAHCLLIRDVTGRANWSVVLLPGGLGSIMSHNGYGLVAGIAIMAAYWLFRKLRSSRPTVPILADDADALVDGTGLPQAPV